MDLEAWRGKPPWGDDGSDRKHLGGSDAVVSLSQIVCLLEEVILELGFANCPATTIPSWSQTTIEADQMRRFCLQLFVAASACRSRTMSGH